MAPADSSSIAQSCTGSCNPSQDKEEKIMKITNGKLIPVLLLLALIAAACTAVGAQEGPPPEEPAEAPEAEESTALEETGPLVVEGIELPPTAGGAAAEAVVNETAANTRATTGVEGVDINELEELEDEDDVRPSPPSIGADVPVTYFGPPPTSVNENFVGPNQLLTAGELDEDAGYITLPLYRGRLASNGPNDGRNIWYIVTDTSDEGNADALGLNFSPKLNYSNLPPEDVDFFTSTSVRRSFFDRDGILVFQGGFVDFSPERSVTPGSTDTSGTNNLLDTVTAIPGAVGTDVGDADGFYSPLTLISNAGGHTYNAPAVSNASESTLQAMCGGEINYDFVHDSVVSICPGEGGDPGTVTLELVPGFSFGRPVLYLSMDSNLATPAALEGAIHAPAMSNIPVGRDDSLFSSVERIFGFTNGPVSADNEGSDPHRQGFNSAILGEGEPLNVLGGIPTIATDYSPLWDLNLGEWTQDAIDQGVTSRLTEEFQILGFVEDGWLTGPGGSAYGSSGVLINCPIVHRFL